MEQQQQYNPVVFSTNFRSAGRTYFLNMLESKKSTKYIKITESRETNAGEYEKHMILLFENGVVRLSKALNQAILEMGKAKSEEIRSTETLSSEEDQPSITNENELFPNSGKRWADEDEAKLGDLFSEGKSVDELCEIFGRSPGGIETRLQKLELVEA